MKKDGRYGNRSKTRILVADDARDAADRLTQMLAELEQVEVIGPAANGLEALKLYINHSPHGAVLDLHMPGINGLELLEVIRMRDRDSLIIMLTNQESGELRNRCLAAGADHYFQKSTEFEKAMDKIAHFLKKRKQSKDARRVD